MTIPDRIALLRRELSRRGLDGCLVVTDDFHGSEYDLMRAGQPGVPKLSDFLAERLPEDGVLAFDGRTVSTRLYRTLTDALAPKHIRLDGSRDLADEVWPDRPPLSAQPLWPLESDVSEEEAAFTEAAEEQLAQTQAQRRYFYLRR